MQDISQRRDRKKGKASVKEDGGRGITFRYIREVKRRDRYENVFVRPMNYVKTLKLQSRVGNLDLPERRRVPVVGRRRGKTLKCACFAKF